ncbi:MAG: hypothetical protein EOP09_01000 [Proteobacteria bacterium]|nr:MAG: hypothetical protein EOP09_01000 [Pseudomonadota bacterium]
MKNPSLNVVVPSSAPLHEVVPILLFDTLPLNFDSETMPFSSPLRYLHAFTAWIVEATDDAAYQLDQLLMDADDIEVKALHTAQVANFSPENSPFADGSFNDDHAKDLEAFLIFHLAKARLERFLKKCHIFRRLAFSWVSRDELPVDLKDQFKARFQEFLSTYEESWQGQQWKESGLTFNDVLEEFWAGHKGGVEVTREDNFKMWNDINTSQALRQS